MKNVMSLVFCMLLIISNFTLHAQCAAGKISVGIDVKTDNYGYELYWQLLPEGNNCGSAAVFSGGNTAVGCNGGGDQNQSPGGYGNNQTFSEGPWCLDENAAYDIYVVDDWGDGGTKFTVNIEGYPVHQFQSASTDERFTFSAVAPPALDAAITEIRTPAFLGQGSVNIQSTLQNTGTTVITSAGINYSINNGAPKSASLTNLSVQPFTEHFFTHSIPWMPADSGTYLLRLWVSNVNGNAGDANATNDELTKTITVKAPIPNIINWYTAPGNNMTIKTIATSDDDVAVARDLDFAPTGQLWIINKETEQSGGTTVTFENPGTPQQVAHFKKDGNSWHFMSLPTGIAFSNNGNFATTPGVFDANHNGGDPFTGPALWSSDFSIYAQNFGTGLGSHLDMLHASPMAMGIASAGDNKFWVFDSHNNDIVYYDFQADHGPGNDDHSDGIIRRYKGMSVSRINDHIVSHLAYDFNSGWLYIVDGGNQRVLRLNTETGTPGGAPSFGPFEPLEEYVNITGATWEVLVDTGLVEPAGIDIIEDRMIVSEHSTGEIIFYDILSAPATEITRIATGSPGVMGIVIGPDGMIWYVNATDNTVMKLEPDSIPPITGIATPSTAVNLKIFPVPASDEISFIFEGQQDDAQLKIYNMRGQLLTEEKFSDRKIQLDVRLWPAGVYAATLIGSGGSSVRKFVVE